MLLHKRLIFTVMWLHADLSQGLFCFFHTI